MTIRCLIIAALALLTLENHAPVVKIRTPAANATLQANTPARFEITVADAEDGDSQYDEINPKEVILEIRSAASASAPGPTASAQGASAPSTSAPDQPAHALSSPGLAVMARSNCFNCHQFNGKLIGPSLADIARHYPATSATTDTLARRIKEGSAGIWGKEKMPSHPELDPQDIRAMVQWIEQYAAAPGVSYQNGTSGLLQFPNAAIKPGVYILTAAYTDHGAKETKAGPWLTGLDHVTLTVK